ncbi:MAG: 4-hydroxy-tetrahydrodipicolinate reductase [Armatimonadetes bacterium]|nr:MAG: 4-hydroxy-tetrahydrodipicolinate reductase [Armatimonadota bacterium]
MSERPIRLALAGAAGKMGAEVVAAVQHERDIELVLVADRSHGGESLRKVLGTQFPDLKIDERLGAALDREKPDVLVDFTHPAAAPEHALSALTRGIAVVIGTSGVSSDDLKEIAIAADRSGKAALVVPNFAIGAVLMMRFCELAARWMPNCEIVEMHHDAKADAPSGTAHLTAERIGRARSTPPKPIRTEVFRVEGVRGGAHEGVPIHSVRLPGLVAHQQVIFGARGETLILRHDSLDRSSFMEGVRLAIRRVGEMKGLVVGLDSLLFED